MKKLAILCLSVLLVAGCSTKPTTTPTATPTATPTVEATQKPAATPTEEPTEEPVNSVLSEEEIQKRMEAHNYVISIMKDYDENHDAVLVKLEGAFGVELLIPKGTDEVTEFVTTEKGKKGTNKITLHLADQKQYIVYRNIEEDGKVISQSCVGYDLDEDEEATTNNGNEKCLYENVDYSNAIWKSREVQFSNAKITKEDVVKWANWYFKNNK